MINNPNLSDLLDFAGELPLNTSYGLEKWLKSKEGLPVCFLLDGIDEYRQGYNNRSNYIYKLVVGDELVRSTVIITSRPRHSWHFRNRVTTNVIILGFDDVSTAQFVHTYFKLTFQPQSNSVTKLLSRQPPYYKSLPHSTPSNDDRVCVRQKWKITGYRIANVQIFHSLSISLGLLQTFIYQ